ncbi:hypothetical protein Lal_00013780 [Lupinus albus]|nr:hypothetical protein Lal_00013780 [Lupinus albus]
MLSFKNGRHKNATTPGRLSSIQETKSELIDNNIYTVDRELWGHPKIMAEEEVPKKLTLFRGASP